MRQGRWFNTILVCACVLASTIAPAAANPPSTSNVDAPDETPKRIQFSFSGATFQEVIDFFSRATGLPVIWESAPPEGTLDYISPESYDTDEAMRVLNIILQSKGVMLRVNDDMLYLQKLADMSKEDIPTYVGQLPDNVTDDQIITVVRPLQVAIAKSLAEKLATMVASYGSVTPMSQQNSLIIVETAAQVRRLLTIIEELDRDDPEGQIEIFPVRNARAEDLMGPLNALLAIKTEKFVVQADGNQVRIEDNQMPGLNITPDPRTNSIVAKGTQQRIDKLRDVLVLLDVPATQTSRELRSFDLNRLSASEAAKQLNSLFPPLNDKQKKAGKQRPTIIAVNDANRVTVVGSEAEVAESEALLRQIDDLSTVASPSERDVAVVALQHADPNGAVQAIKQLLDTRQSRDLRLIAGPDGRSVLVSGPNADVQSARALLTALDQPDRSEQQIRVLTVEGDRPAEIVARATELHQRRTTSPSSFWQEFDVANRMLTLIGAPRDLDEFETTFRTLEGQLAVNRETRYVTLQHSQPSVVADIVRTMSTRLFRVPDGSVGMEPTVEPIDELDMLVISAGPDQLKVIDTVLRNVDVPTSESMPPLRILQLRSADAGNLAGTLMRQFDRRPAEERREKPVQITADPNTNALIVAAHESMLPEIQGIVEDLNQVNRQDYEGREIRIFPLKVARAEELARTIDEMFPEPQMPRDRRGRPMPQLQEPREVVVRADVQTNALIVDAPVQRMAGFQQLVEQLDRQKFLEESEVRTYKVIHADLTALANTLRTLASNGSLNPSGRDARVGISITTEPISQSIVVSGPVAVFDRVEEVLDELDTRRARPTTVLRFYTLEFARADALANMLRSVLSARLTEDVPEAGMQGEALLNVTADGKTNTVIISAPESLMPVAEALIEQLDVEGTAAGDSTIRIRPLTFADARQITDSLGAAMPGMISPATGQPIKVKLIPAPGSNAILLVGLPVDLDEVESLIEPLDARPALDAIDARTFRLAHADAQRIAPIVSNLLTDQQATDPRIVLERIRRSRGQVDLTPKIRVEADQRTNSLIVSGPQRTVSLAETLIGKLDQPADDRERSVRMYAPSRARADELASRVQRVIELTQPGGRRSRVELIAENQDSTILIIGTSDEIDAAMALLEERDARTPVIPPVDLRIVRLERTDASVIAGTMNGLLQDRSRWPEPLQQVVRAGLPIAQPTVSADTTRNRLLISAPDALMPLADELIAEFERDMDANGPVDVRVFSLVQADAQNVAAAINASEEAIVAADPMTERARVVAEPSTNTLIVTSSADRMAGIESLIARLDTGMSSDAPQLRMIRLKHVRAEVIVPTVRELVAADEVMPMWMRFEMVRRNLTLDSNTPEVRVAANEQLNALMVSATPAVLDMVEQMVAQLDVDPSTSPSSVTSAVRVIALDHADASELAENISSLFDGADGAAPPVIRVDRASNTLLVRATDTQFAVIQNVVDSIDDATISASRQLQLIPVDPTRANAADVARTLEQLMDTGSGNSIEVITVEELLRRQQERSQPAEDSTSSRNTVDELLGHLAMMTIGILPENGERKWYDVLRDGASSPVLDEILAAQPAPQPEVAALAVPEPSMARDDASSDADVTIAVDAATNSLVVIGSPRAIERVQALASQLQDQLPAPGSRVRMVPMPEGIDAATVARLANQVIRQIAPPSGRRGDIARRASIVSDTQANTVVVTSSDLDFNLIGDLIATFARPSTTDRLAVKIYPLRTITANRAADSVRSLLQPAGNARRGRQAQRVRQLALTLLEDDAAAVEAVFDPSKVRVSSDTQNNALIVTGSADALAFIDRFVSLIDQTPTNTQSTLKLYPLQAAQASDLQQTLRRIFQSRFRSMRNQPGGATIQPEFASDARTNTLLVTASPEQLQEIDQLLVELDQKTGDDRFPLRVVELDEAPADQAARLLDRVVIGNDRDRREATSIIADSNSGVLLIRASDEVMAEIETVLAEVDRDATSTFDVRTITLERANAQSVATALQRFYDDRARIASSARGRRGQSRRVSIIGDDASRTLLIAASDSDYKEISQLVAQFDSPQATDQLMFRVFELKHAKATDIESTVRDLVEDLTWNQGPFFFSNSRMLGGSMNKGTIAVRADGRLNALIATGEGNKFDVVEQIIEVLDMPASDTAQRTVKIYRLRHADVNVVREVVEDVYAGGNNNRRWWEPDDTTGVRVEADRNRNVLIVSATTGEQDEIGELITEVDSQMASAQQEVVVVPVQFADANEIARNLTQFLRTRARARNQRQANASVLANRSSNSLIIAAPKEDVLTIRDVVARLDQADISGDRVIEIIALEDGDADEISRILREQFGRRGGKGVIVTADMRTNSLIVNAPQEEFAQAQALIARLDSPSASDETIIRTYTLEGARATEAVDILASTLQLDADGETSGITIKLDETGDAVEVKGRIVADRRSNSLIVTATAESFPVIESLITQLDEVPSVSPVEYRIIGLEFAMADDVTFTLERMVRSQDPTSRPRIDYNRRENQLIVAATNDQFEQIERIVRELDQPSENERVTDFVPLDFAEAVQVKDALTVFYGPMAIEADTPGKLNVRIVADPATNSLVISAAEAEWAGIRSLLEKLDSEEYDSSLQLRVLPLRYADASSVARAINEAFQGTIERGNRNEPRNQNRSRENDDRRDRDERTVLVEAEEWVRASAEPLTNAVVVSASRQNIRKIEQIVSQLDVADFASLPAPRLIPVIGADPVQLADSLRRLYAQTSNDARARSGRGLRIVGDKDSNTIIVRADDEEFAQINALATALQNQMSTQGLGVHVIHLAAAPASRVATAIRQAFSERAAQAGQPLSIDVDAAGNNLIVACSGGLLAEIQATVAQLDALTPAAGQSIFIIELEHVSPDAATNVIQSIGLDRPQPDDSVSRLVAEPIRVTAMQGRNALIIVANPADQDTVIGLLKTIDAEPALAESLVRVVPLRKAEAGAVVDTLERMLAPGEQQADTPLARAVQEQVRRLAVRRNGVNEPDLNLDLTRPISIIPNDGTNAVIISSTPANVSAIEELVVMLDALPLTDAVTVQLFPLENIDASQFARIVRELFDQGKQLAEIPGADRRAIPGGLAGQALMDELAISVDERTNTVIVAGKEEAVALVEVLSLRIDSEVAAGWVEPRILPLRFADATDLSESLRAILVEGTRDLPQAMPLQRQVARLRMARVNENGGAVLESDVFTPMSRLIIRPEPQLNALLLVGTPANLEVVGELVGMLDVEAASPSAVVRVYPIEHASAARLAAVITRLFEQQVQSKAIRPEDRVVVQAEERTNSLIVTTSPRSFAVLETLLSTLDAEVAPDLREIRRIDLTNASAVRLANLIQDLMDARLERLRRVQPETADLERATILPDPRTNSLVIAAGNESYEVIKRLAAELDDSTLEDTSLVEVLTLEEGNVERIAETIDAIMERRYADLPDEIRRSQRPLVLTDPRSNALLVAANPEDIASIRELVARLESAPVNPAVGLTVLAVPSTTNAEELAQRLQRLMRDREQTLGPARTPADRVTIEPESTSNSLIVAANAENLAVIRSLIDVLDEAGADAMRGRDVEIVSLASSRAEDIVPLLDELYVDEVNRTRGDNTVRATADDRLNAVLLKGQPEDITAMRQLIAQLDGAKPASVVEIRFVALASANALETVGLIEDILSGRGIGRGRGSEQATVLRYLRQIGDATGNTGSEIEVSAAIRQSITLTPDVRTNTVVVSAPRESIDMIEQMIRDLDSTSVGAKNIRIFKLANADATAMAGILTDLFNLRQQTGLNVLKPREGESVEGGIISQPGFEGVELTTVPDERQQLSITVDSRTNSLLVSGTPRYLDLVSEVVEELDALEANEREVFVYPLRNAVAEDVARVIGDFVDQEQEKLLATVGVDQLGSAARLLEREITIQGDAQSNTVLVSASPRYMDTVRQMIGQLDVDPPQVLIQVMLAEVTLDSLDEFGVDANLSFEVGSADVAGGFGFASAFVTGMGVPNLSIVSSDFELMLRAIQEQGRLQVLSNPSIMAANNVPARLQVGETIRVPEGSFRNDLGQTSTDLIAEEIGVILEVTPTINPDGFVRMDIRPEISSLSDRTTQVSEEFESPIITRREANTIVTVKDGQTIVIGGLISDRFENRNRKVPLLGDIPLIGLLFRSETTTTTKTELLIVLTPYVIDSPSSFDSIDFITEDAINRLTVPEEVKAKIRDHRRDGTGSFFDATRGETRGFDRIPVQPRRNSGKLPPADTDEADEYSYPLIDPK
ncbi:MAG: secretin N-terminal domain-containing protein [Planctomycetota bacterium]